MLVRFALTFAVLALLSACSSFEVVSPKEGTVVTLPAATSVVLVGNPSLSKVQVREGNNDFSGQMSYPANNRSEGNLALPAGRHTLDVGADVPCWYCSGGTFRHSETRKICVVAAGPGMAASKTARSNATGNLSWSAAGPQNIVVAADGGQPPTRWSFWRVGGFTSSTGIIESVAFPCLCLRSMDAAQGTAVGMAMCDTTDPLQQWQALQLPAAGAGNFRMQNNGRGVSDACLTEGAAPGRTLIQRACNDTPDQLWSFRDNTTGQTGVAPFF